MTKLERRGLRNLTAKRPAPLKSATWIVRIYYRSMADELLCCDTEPMTSRAADALRGTLNGREIQQCANGTWKTHRVSLYDAELAEVMHVSEVDRRLPLRDARKVVFPHAVTE